MRMKEFNSLLNQLGFKKPKDIFFEERKEGIRVAAKTLMSVKIKGKRGFLVFSTSLTQPFVLAFGKNFSKRFYLNDEEFLKIANGEKIKIKKGEEGYYIAFYKKFPVCLVKIKEKELIPFVSKGLKRKLINKLK